MGAVRVRVAPVNEKSRRADSSLWEPVAGRDENSLMLHKVGRLLQFAGLVILPVAIAGDMSGRVEFKHSLAMSLIGIVVFFTGWLLQQAARPR
jgi:hypothetical protein